MFPQTAPTTEAVSATDLMYVPTKKKSKAGRHSLWKCWTSVLACSTQTFHHFGQKVDICEIMKIPLETHSAAGQQ